MSSQINIRVLQVSTGSVKVHPNDVLRLCVTTFPDNKKYEHLFLAKDKYNINHTWDIPNKRHKITKVLITLRKKSFFEMDPIIGRKTFSIEKAPADEVSYAVVDLTHKLANNIDNGQMRVEIHNNVQGVEPFAAPKVNGWQM